MKIREATPSDLQQIVEIYNASIPGKLATADTEIVSIESKKEWFNSHKVNNLPILVADDSNEVLAWVSLEPFYGRPAYKKTAEISIYVSPKHAKKGLASRLCQHIFEHLEEYGLNCLVAFVFAHNAPSVALFEKFNFQSWGNLPEIAEMDGRKLSLLILGRHFN